MIINKNLADRIISTMKEHFAYAVHTTNARIFHADLTGNYPPVQVMGGNNYLYGELNHEILPLLKGFESMLIEDGTRLPPIERKEVSQEVVKAARRGDECAKAIVFYHATGLVHYFNTPLEILAGRVPFTAESPALFDILLIRDKREGGIAHFNESSDGFHPVQFFNSFHHLSAV